MASGAFSTGYVSPNRRQDIRSVAQPASGRATTWPWRAIADAASCITFIGVLGWGMWNIGSQLLPLAPQVAAVWEGYPL